jgi:hypothetical protein
MAIPSRYQALADYLACQPSGVNEVTLTLNEIAAIIGGPLSESAYRGNWWTNSHPGPHARAWRQAGWRVLRPAGQRYGPRVVFERVRP